MKKKSLSPVLVQRLKNAGLLIVYWIIFIIIPFVKMNQMVNNFKCGPVMADNKSALNIFLFIFFISILLLFIPYKLAKFPCKADKIIFVILGLLVSLCAIFGTIGSAMFLCATGL